MKPDEKIALIHRLATQMHQSLASAPIDTLTGPTACSEWDVGTVMAHLTGGVMRQCDSMRRGRNGHGGPPDGTTTVTTPDQVQQRNAMSNQQFRAELGDTLLTRFRDEYAALDDLLHEWTDWRIGCWHHRRGTISADSYLDLRIQELVIHDWDMRSGGTGQAAMDADGVSALLPGSEMWYELCFRPLERLPQPVAYRFEVDEGTTGTSLRHDVIIAGDSFTVDKSANPHTADLTIRCNAETYLLCLYGRVDWVAAQREGRISVVSRGNAQPGPERENTFHKDSLIQFRKCFGGL